jgi:hypothetical protein
MLQIELEFKGICTHLLAPHLLKAPDFTLRAGDRQPIQHRVFLANSALIQKHMPVGRQPIPHVPKLIICPKEVKGDLAKLFTADGVWKLDNVGVCFEGVDTGAGDPFHYVTLTALPHIWMRAGGEGDLRDGVKAGWTPFATAYVDFIGGVKFRTMLENKMWQVRGTLFFNHSPVMAVRDRNVGPRVPYSLDGVSKITISNEPELAECEENDYLLNYFATDLDLLKNAPKWAFPGEGRSSEVYCSSSQYP